MKSNEYKKGLWTVEEDSILTEHVRVHGKGRWSRIPQATGLKRCGKSCRLRWVNYLSPNVKLGDFSREEEDLIIRLHNLLGNRWSLIAGRVPGRTDNQVKNHWNTHLRRKVGFDGHRRGNNAPIPATTTVPHSSSNEKAAEDQYEVNNVEPWTSAWLSGDELNPACAPNSTETLGDFALDFILYGR